MTWGEELAPEARMAEPTNEGVAYLTALKQSSGLYGTSAPEPVAGQQPQTGPVIFTPPEDGNYQGVEKRRSPRYKCEGSVEMREESGNVGTFASFTDVSLHGCYVEAQATYPAGTSLRMKLEANGVRVETKGTVRVNYPYLGMGVSFTEMTDENRERLKELVMAARIPSTIMGPGILPPRLPGAGDPELTISNPGAAMTALVEFFQNRHMLTREEFIAVVHKSQAAAAAR